MHEDKTLYAKVPILRGVDTYTAWKTALQTYLITIGCERVVDGTEIEPPREIGTEGSRVTRAATAAAAIEEISPITSTTTPEAVATTTKLEETAWDKWYRKEQRAKGVIRSTVSKGLLVDLLDMRTAKEMWDFLAVTHPTDTPESRASL